MERERTIKKILILVLFLNWLVAGAKLILGFFIKSISMIADGFHSFSDGASNIVGLIGISMASKPADKEHLYGHKKYETFASLIIAGILFLVVFNLLREAGKRFLNPLKPLVNIYAILVMLMTLAINIFVSKYEYKKGKQLNSDILISDSLHTLSDILTSLSVIIALIASKIGFPLVDIFSSLLIVLFITYAGFKILKETSKVLCDTAVIETAKIEDIVRSVDEVLDCHKIRTRGRKDDIHMDLHVVVKPDMHMDKAHKISYEIEEKIKKAFPYVTDIVVHMESFIKKKNKKGVSY
jgi:cation diffusion facilitator family transporter